MTRIRAVEGSIWTSGCARLITAVVTVAVIVVHLRVLDRTTTVETGERVPWLVQTGPADRHATGTGNVAVYIGDAGIGGKSFVGKGIRQQQQVVAHLKATKIGNSSRNCSILFTLLRSLVTKLEVDFVKLR